VLGFPSHKPVPCLKALYEAFIDLERARQHEAHPQGSWGAGLTHLFTTWQEESHEAWFPGRIAVHSVWRPQLQEWGAL
jgi:hypothetical protein